MSKKCLKTTIENFRRIVQYPHKLLYTNFVGAKPDLPVKCAIRILF